MNDKISSQRFLEICELPIENIIEVSESILKAKKHTDKGFGLFSLLDIWQALVKELPKVKLLFTVHILT
jgi:hypothetical protein